MSTQTGVTTYAPGTFSWVDLCSPDAQASIAFYSGLFGWTHQQLGDSQQPYVMFFKDGKEVCGMVNLTADLKAAGIRPHWLSYVSVENAEATAKQASALGGQTMKPSTDAMGAGRFAVILDPTGAAFGLWQPIKHQGAQLVNQVGSFCWNELLTKDAAAATTFYTQLFHWKAKTQNNFGMDYTMFENAGKDRAGMMAFDKVPPNWLVYFVVKSYDESEAKAVQLGAHVMMPAKDIPGLGKFGVLTDPAGASFAIMQMAG